MKRILITFLFILSVSSGLNATENTNKVIIVGGGISGLNTALRLVESGKVSPHNIEIIEKLGRVGGRIHSFQAQSSTYELGAARINPFLHPELFKLIERFEIEVEPFEYQPSFDLLRLNGKHEVPELLKAAIKAVKSPSETDKKLHGMPFSQGLRLLLGHKSSLDLLAGIGYDAFKMEFMTFAQAVDILLEHPETHYILDSERIGTGGEFDWKCCPNGLQELTEKMQLHLEGLGVVFTFNTVFERLSGSQEAIFVSGDNEHIKKVFTNLFFTGSASEISRHFDLFQEEQHRSIPLIKIFFKIAKIPNHLAKKINKKMIITDLPLRKIYVDNGQHWFAYSDSQSALRMKDILEADGSQKALSEMIANSLEISYQDLEINDMQWKFWGEGVEIPSNDDESNNKTEFMKFGNIYFISDYHSDIKGFIEGAIRSSISAISDFTESAK